MIRMFLLTAFVLGFSAACGGDDDGSGVDSDKPLSEATVEDAMALCEYGEAIIDEEDAAVVGCYAAGIFAAQQGGDCQATADACLEEPVEENDGDCEQLTQADVDDLPDCASMVTFGELEGCTDAQAAALSELADEISCDTDPDEIFALPAGCESINEECPELFEDDGAA